MGRMSGLRRRSSMYAAGALWCAATRKTSPSRRYSTPNVAPHRRVAFDSAVANTGCRLPGELEMTLSTSDVAVCCCSDSRSSLSSRAFSMAITAWLAKFLTKSVFLEHRDDEQRPKAAQFNRGDKRWVA